MTEHFDAAAFGALRQTLGDEMVEMLLGKYLVQMEEKVGLLREGVEARDMAQVRQQAHDLTSSSGSVGLGAMSNKASACEFAVKEGREEAALEHARELIALAPETAAAIRAAFPSLA